MHTMDILKETLKITENINYIFVNYYNKMPWNMKSSFPNIFQKNVNFPLWNASVIQMNVVESTTFQEVH